MQRADKRKYHYIYKITRNDGRYYIGMHSTDNLDDGYFGSGQRLWHSISKHGKDKHSKEIIEFLNSREALKKREAEIITEEMLGDKLCMNLKLGGAGGWDHLHTPTPENIAKRENAQRLAVQAFQKWVKIPENNAKHRARCSDQLKLKHAQGKMRHDTFIGRKHTQETKDKISVAFKSIGERNGAYGTCWVMNEEHCKRIPLFELTLYIETGYTKGRRIQHH